MTDTELRSGVVKLSETVTQLSQAVQSQAENTTSLSNQVRESNERTEANRKFLRRLSILMAAKLVTLVLLFVLFDGIKETNKTIESCTTPDGECAQRSAAATSQAINSLAFRNELQRIETELPISEAKHDTVRVTELTARRTELIGLIEQSDNALRDIQTRRVPVAATTTTLNPAPSPQ